MTDVNDTDPTEPQLGDSENYPEDVPAYEGDSLADPALDSPHASITSSHDAPTDQDHPS